MPRCRRCSFPDAAARRVSADSVIPVPDNRLRQPLDGALTEVPACWRPIVQAWRDSAAGRQLASHVLARQLAGADIVPGRVLRALELTHRPEVRVVILGQDPYHGPGQAEGLAFSVPGGTAIPPSLRNIRAEVERDLGRTMSPGGSLHGWARQGVLLLNTVLTVELGLPASHAARGWEALTDSIVMAISSSVRPVVFMLWGAHARGRAQSIAAVGHGRHLVLQCNHPSPLSARRGANPFVGCGHFGLASRFLATNLPRGPELDWARSW